LKASSILDFRFWILRKAWGEDILPTNWAAHKCERGGTTPFAHGEKLGWRCSSPKL